MTWNPDNPVTSDAILDDVTDVKENLNELMLSVMNRATFTYNGAASAASVKVSGGYYCCKDKFCYWASELTTSQAASGTPTGSTWYYLYLDYSGITSGTAITNSELLWSTTAPTFSHTYRGWYNGDDRCIFACVANFGGTNFVDFYHDGDYVVFGDDVLCGAASKTSQDYSSIAPSTTWDDCYLAIPAFSKRAQITILGTYVDADAAISYRTNGSSGTGVYVMGVFSDFGASVTHARTLDVVGDSDGIIELAYGGATTNQINATTIGWYFSNGI